MRNKPKHILVRPETEDRLAMGNSSQIPISRGSEFPPRVLPPEPVRWMRVDFEAAAENWDEWKASISELDDATKDSIVEKFEDACTGAGDAICADTAEEFQGEANGW